MLFIPLSQLLVHYQKRCFFNFLLTNYLYLQNSKKKSGVPEGHTALACLNSEKSLSVSVRK